jgi:hypothetical protein|tara:strand:- start:4981 stop:5169 length:189 start_codon:yes stop_codon:yes gene_type:complete
MSKKEIIDDIANFLSQHGIDSLSEKNDIVQRIYELLILNKPSILKSKYMAHDDYNKYHTWPC